MKMMTDRWLKSGHWVLPVAMIIFLFLVFFVFGASGDDDSHITYTTAKNFAETGRVTNNNNEMVEQGSSLLHVLLLGITYKVIAWISPGISIADIGPLFSLFFAILSLPLMYVFLHSFGVRRMGYPLILLAVSPALGYWALGGLEATLVTVCVLYLLLSWLKFLSLENPQTMSIHAVISLGLYLLVRPEAFFIVIAFLAFLALLLYFQGKTVLLYRLAVLVGISLLLFIALCSWRYSLYGQILPQPVYAKSDGISLQRLMFGFFYFIYSMQLTIMIYVICLLVLAWRVVIKHHVLPLAINLGLAFSLAMLSFIIASGGDWMTGGRFFVPFVPLLIAIAAFMFQAARHYKLIACLAVLLSCFEVAWFATHVSAGIPVQNIPGFLKQYPQVDWSHYSLMEKSNMVHARDIPAVNALGDILEALPSRGNNPVSIVSTQMGLIPHHLHDKYGEAIKFVDLRGLATPEVTRCADFSQNRKNWFGVSVTYQDYFLALERGECMLPRADIIYDLLDYAPEEDRNTLAALKKNGYQIVYIQSGNLVAPSGYKKVKSGTFIAVSMHIFNALPVDFRNRKIEFI